MGPIIVSGPGPIEPGTTPVPSPLPAPLNTSKPSPPLPPDSGAAGGLLEGDGSGGDEEDEEEDVGFAAPRQSGTGYAPDPYASLDAAFGDTQDDANLRDAHTAMANFP